MIIVCFQSYNDYMREFHGPPSMAMGGYPGLVSNSILNKGILDFAFLFVSREIGIVYCIINLQISIWRSKSVKNQSRY